MQNDGRREYFLSASCCNFPIIKLKMYVLVLYPFRFGEPSCGIQVPITPYLSSFMIHCFLSVVISVWLRFITNSSVFSQVILFFFLKQIGNIKDNIWPESQSCNSIHFLMCLETRQLRNWPFLSLSQKIREIFLVVKLHFWKQLRRLSVIHAETFVFLVLLYTH